MKKTTKVALNFPGRVPLWNSSLCKEEWILLEMGITRPHQGKVNAMMTLRLRTSFTKEKMVLSHLHRRPELGID